MTRLAAALLFIILAAARPALATQDAWPALHDVSGVEAGDVLNIRAAPDAGAKIVGGLAPDATDIEVIAPSDNPRWGLVNTAEGRGWAALRYLRRQPGQWLGAVPPMRHCSGTEPFWSLALPGDGTLRFATPEAETDGLGFRPVASQNRRDRYAMTFRLDDGRRGVLIAG
ncbi:SH3 domain-containing protein, partial [Stappia sp.]|uniref:SH3 domain-containing protein n=1 Tax=Stappia sp. TaxID=1870903 RepID=UPI003A999191